jgi:IS30 family transposase
MCAGSWRRPEELEDHLELTEREEISRGLAMGCSARTIAVSLGRSPSTISREIARNGGRSDYRAPAADRLAYQRARRPKAAKLAACPRLRVLVEDKLKSLWSPEQIAGWLRRHFPDHPTMRVSHEAIYPALFDPPQGDRPHPDAAVADRAPDATPETGPQA